MAEKKQTKPQDSCGNRRKCQDGTRKLPFRQYSCHTGIRALPMDQIIFSSDLWRGIFRQPCSLVTRSDLLTVTMFTGETVSDKLCSCDIIIALKARTSGFLPNKFFRVNSFRNRK